MKITLENVEIMIRNKKMDNEKKSLIKIKEYLVRIGMIYNRKIKYLRR